MHVPWSNWIRRFDGLADSSFIDFVRVAESFDNDIIKSIRGNLRTVFMAHCVFLCQDRGENCFLKGTQMKEAEQDNEALQRL